MSRGFVYHSKPKEVSEKSYEERKSELCSSILYWIENISEKWSNCLEITPYQLGKNHSDFLIKDCCMEIIGGDFKSFKFYHNKYNPNIITIVFYYKRRGLISRFLDRVFYNGGGV